MLRGASVRALREALSVHGATRATMPREELVALARDAGAAESDEHAERVVDALHDAGVVLRVRDDVLLRPEVLTAAVGAALGARGTAEGGGVVLTDSLRKRLSELRERVNDELKPLAAEHDEIERSAVRRARAILWTGYAGLLTQFGVFYQLTFYELSWDGEGDAPDGAPVPRSCCFAARRVPDARAPSLPARAAVMEPVSYFTGLALMIGGYTYFMTTERECTNQNVFQKIVCQRMDTLYAKQGFDVRKYGALKEQVAQLDRMLQGS